MTRIAIAGNHGGKIRSDCRITGELHSSGGIHLDLKSKIKAMYGEHIISFTKDMLAFYGIKNIKIVIEDSGALDFVIAARLESMIRQLTNTDKQYILPVIEENQYPSSKEQFRLSRLYVPGNTPGMMLNAGVYKPCGIILDLEDSVAQDKKEEAKILVRNALCRVNFYGVERMVRINQMPQGLDDLGYIIPYNVHLVLIPKCESVKQVEEVAGRIKQVEKESHRSAETFLMPILESALGIENAFDIACSSERIVAMAIGLEDYTADIGVQRTHEGRESFYARTRFVNACKAAGIQPIDSVYSDVADMEGLKQAVSISRSLGFEGMGCIHPRQIKAIHECFMPDQEELEKALRIVEAFREAESQGLGVVSLGTKMIDPPVVKRALNTIKLHDQMSKSNP